MSVRAGGDVRTRSRCNLSLIAWFLIMCIVIFGKYLTTYFLDDTYSCLFADKYKPVLNHTVNDIEAVENNVRYMLSTGHSELHLLSSYSSLKSCCDAYVNAMGKYPEFNYDRVHLVDWNGMLMVRLESAYDDKDRKMYTDMGLNAAKSVRDELYANGKLTSVMSEVEKARVYYDWIIDNCEPYYDVYEELNIEECFELHDIPLEYRQYFTAYGVFVLKKATVGGYCSAYNLFLRLEGIDCVYVDNGVNGWTVATLDGIAFDISVFDADVSGRRDAYFCMDSDCLMS